MVPELTGSPQVTHSDFPNFHFCGVAASPCVAFADGQGARGEGARGAATGAIVGRPLERLWARELRGGRRSSTDVTKITQLWPSPPSGGRGAASAPPAHRPK